MTDFVMPSLSDAMEEGTIAKWLIEDGHAVAVGDELVEIETDKATMAVTAETAGVLTIIAPEGSAVAVGDIIARIGDGPASAPSHPGGENDRRPEPPGPPEPPEAAEPIAAIDARHDGDEAVASTPLARRVAREHNVSLATITGTGPRGRVTKLDVFRAVGIEPKVEASPGPTPVAAVAAEPGPVPAGSTLRPTTRLQQTIARRMTEQATVPVFQVQTDVEMDAAIVLRADLKRLAREGDVAPSVNDLIIRACALALRSHPLVNGCYRPDGFLVHDHVNVGMAVASDVGLLVATIPDADRKSLGQIAVEARALALKVRDGNATPAELGGGTFTVSNLGMFGMTQITAVINPPQAAILGVGAARAVLARTGSGDVVERQLLALTLTCDHRILNGADGARFLQDVKALLETPLRMAL